MSQPDVAPCPQCGFPLDSSEHRGGLGNIHNPGFVPVDPRAKAEARKEFWAQVYADEAARGAEDTSEDEKPKRGKPSAVKDNDNE